MTAVFNNSGNFFFNTNRKMKEFQVEVITFDGECEVLYVEARTASEAQSKAARLVDNADYVMVQGCNF